MPVTDTIGDMLTSIRNANIVRLKKVDIPASRTKERIIKILRDEGYVKGYKKIEDTKQGILRVYMTYGPNKERVINGIKRLSTPGLRFYCGKKKIPKVFSGVGLTILSTSKGVMTDKKARRENVGGEVLCYIW